MYTAYRFCRHQSKDYFVRFKKVISRFPYGMEERPKIAYQRLISSYEFAGLKLQDLQLKDTCH